MAQSRLFPKMSYHGPQWRRQTWRHYELPWSPWQWWRQTRRYTGNTSLVHQLWYYDQFFIQCAYNCTYTYEGLYHYRWFYHLGQYAGRANTQASTYSTTPYTYTYIITWQQIQSSKWRPIQITTSKRHYCFFFQCNVSQTSILPGIFY